ncbi:MAG: CcmD family protein [Ferruginibacter sp.]|nr:CcmD family protein [Ferruginibacter sp.]
MDKSNFLNRLFFMVSRLGMYIFLLLISSNIFAQAQQVEMADTMRSNGKIYIVVAVCLTILIGLFIYVFSLDRKISKIEKEQ